MQYQAFQDIRWEGYADKIANWPCKRAHATTDSIKERLAQDADLLDNRPIDDHKCKVQQHRPNYDDDNVLAGLFTFFLVF